MSIPCPQCGFHKTIVKETKSKPNAIRRYRSCENCKTLFTTHEVVAVYSGRYRGMILATPDLDVQEADAE